LETCGDVADAEGVPVGLYAVERLLAGGRSDRAASDHVLRRAAMPAWRSPNEAFLLQSLLRRIASAESESAVEPYGAALRTLAADIRNAERIAALNQDMHDQLGKLQRASRLAPGDLAWVGYGDEPWLLTLVSPTSFAAPVIMAVSPASLVPRGVTLRVAPTPDAVPLGDGFVDVHVAWPAGRFADPRGLPGLLLGSMLILVLGAALLAGYLLLRDVQRETQTATMRSHFVASVSHELKTPLTSIRAHAETLLMGRAGGVETTADYLKTIVSESERLTRLVDSVLDFSRIEQGRRAYRLQPVRLDEVVQAAAKAIEHSLAQSGFELFVSSDGPAPTVRADREALIQAILNLLGNAMKYSGDARRIEMRAGARGDEAFVEVVDHGIGIARDDQARIFERFHRVQSVETTGIAGTGLGLTLALHVVEAHRGRIAVESHPGRGSTFSVFIPLQAHA
jgi:signal transduction histidine kinase